MEPVGLGDYTDKVTSYLVVDGSSKFKTGIYESFKKATLINPQLPSTLNPTRASMEPYTTRVEKTFVLVVTVLGSCVCLGKQGYHLGKAQN